MFHNIYCKSLFLAYFMVSFAPSAQRCCRHKINLHNFKHHVRKIMHIVNAPAKAIQTFRS